MAGKHMKKGIVLLAALAVLVMGTAIPAWASTRLDKVYDVWWDDDNVTVANWEEVEDAYQYEVNLYCNNSKTDTIKTKKLSYDFERKMTKAGDYTFRVRALAKSSDRDYRDSYWSDYSDSIYIDESFAELMKSGGRIDTLNSGPGAGGQWMQDQTGWWYQRSDGTYPANAWFQDPANSKWYYFHAGGYMATGWIDVNGSRYYCGADGAMVTGNQTIDGVGYLFDPSGALVIR